MEMLTLVDGTQLEGSILPSGDGSHIFVYLYGLSLAQGFTVFSNPENVLTITEMSHGKVNVYTGYTEIVAINTEYGNCNLTMKRKD